MNLIDHTTTWVKGEVIQGRIMIVLGIILLVCCFFVWRNGNEIVRGMLIPLTLVVVVLLGYGVFQNIGRPDQLAKLTEAYENNPKETFEMEKARVFKDKNAYNKFKIAWAIVIIGALGFYFFTGQPNYKGMAIGILFLCVSLLAIDTLLQQRSAVYYDNISRLE